MATDSKKGGGAGTKPDPFKGKDGIRVLKCAFREKVRRPGSADASTAMATAAAGDNLLFVPNEQLIYWAVEGKEEVKAVPINNVSTLTLDL